MQPSGVTKSAAVAETRRLPTTPGSPIGHVFLGKYRLTRPLGEGSNAQVYLAHREGKPGELVVVKRIKPDVVANPRFSQFFDNEVRSMAGFRHPFAVRLIDATLTDPLGVGLVLEYIPGVTLERLLLKHRRFPVDRAVRLMGPLLHALQAAHDAGIVHRDLKPANLMVTNAGTPEESVRVMDFGFAGFSSKPHIQLAELTGVGSVFACGTPAYVSPEMVRGDAVDGRGDLYAVGVMLFEMLAGRLPFDHAETDELLAAHVHAVPPRLRRVGAPDVPAAVEGIVNMCLTKYASERPATARDLAEYLSRAVGFDVWTETAPTVTTESGVWECVDLVPVPVESKSAESADADTLSDTFVALLPERLAAVKLRGFIEDVQGHAVASEPGLVRVHLEAANAKPPGSGIFGWLARTTTGKEPIEMNLTMQKLGADRVEVLVAFRPLSGHSPSNRADWTARCDGYYSILRKYLMADG